MRFILDMLERIFKALSGIYTKQETDTALATKADATALTEEAQARQEAIDAEATRVDTRLAEHDAEIDTLQKVTAGLGEGAQAAANVAKWQTYATAIQKDLDAETAMQLAQEFNRATDEYLADPTATKTWNTNSDGVNILESTTCPYAVNPPTVPVVDFNVVVCYANSISVPCFSTKTNVGIFLPSATRTSVCLCRNKIFNSFFFAPKSANWQYCFDGCSSYDQPTLMFGANNATTAFKNTKMSAKNIAKTLDSLPTWTDGKSHVITFTGSTGAAELTLDSPSVANAVAKGWTVEL